MISRRDIEVTIPKEKDDSSWWLLGHRSERCGFRSRDTSGRRASRTNDSTEGDAPDTCSTALQRYWNSLSYPNLATQFRNGVVVDVESQHPGLVISEVMWGEDASLNPSSNSQYIELYNPGAQYKTVADADHTPDINEALTLIFYAPNEFSAVPAKTARATAAGCIASGCY